MKKKIHDCLIRNKKISDDDCLETILEITFEPNTDYVKELKNDHPNYEEICKNCKYYLKDSKDEDTMSFEEWQEWFKANRDKFYKGKYYFYKDEDHPENKIWKVEKFSEDGDLIIGQLLYSFDKKKIFNLWKDYPQNFSKEEKELFDKENPYWAEFFKDKKMRKMKCHI